jgi:hypothetical protein
MKIHLQIVLIGLVFTNLSQTQPSYLAQPASPTKLKAISFVENTNIDHDHSTLPHESLIDADDDLNQNSPNITSLELKAPILQSHLVLLRLIQFYFPCVGAIKLKDSECSEDNE